MTKQSLDAAMDRVLARLDGMSDEEFVSTLNSYSDGPLAHALYGTHCVAENDSSVLSVTSSAGKGKLLRTVMWQNFLYCEEVVKIGEYEAYNLEYSSNDDQYTIAA